MIFFSHCQSNKTPRVPHFIIALILNPSGNWKATELSKRSQALLEKPTSIRSAYLYHAHMHMALFMYTRSCMPTTLSPSPASPPSHTLIVCPNVCMPVYPDVCLLPGLGLIHNTMPSHIRTPFSKSLVNVWVRGMHVCACACVCMCVSQRAD